jgi:two-component system response regulator RegA
MTLEAAVSSATATYLVVDDDRSFCQALAMAIRRRGHAVVRAHDPQEAMAEAEAWRPQRAIVDLRMPGGDGLSLITALRALDPSIEIVVLTGYGSIATAVEAMKLGAVHYLTKPATADEILATFAPGVAGGAGNASEAAAPTTLKDLEWEYLQKTLAACRGNVSETARRLGMHRRSLQRKLSRGRSDR